ncbi:serine/threonine-protein kinase [Actinoallomurus rhizosphaericola]|uniref:serine/threonine-protein kinase n=1 Tax=Actinoallomurus rhizosphaericola TaxID=2952536 RepID=UPI002093A494|nr:serine/threonine-protein kinase [Actinoallomurus rhizosphaericola]MCO5994805.1 serine/threonine protein kinase [Actinoallomurus rhizosphaericola]
MTSRVLLPGDPRRLGPYELTERLGAGGQGVVYLARRADDPGGFPRRLAVKMLRQDLAIDDAARARFVREVAAAKEVARFCTAQVVDADVTGDRPYIVSEYVDGPSLQRLISEKGPRDGADLERLAIATATALVAIHEAGIVHRDFKPQNVLIGPDGARVIDFGIARAFDAAATMPGQVFGTPPYMAPEQLSGGVITTATDVFAWASTVTYAACGHPPFGNDTFEAVAARILTHEPFLGGLESPLRDLVADCLAKDPGDRPSAQQVLLRLLRRSEVVARPAGDAPAGAPATTVMLAAGTALADPTGTASLPSALPGALGAAGSHRSAADVPSGDTIAPAPGEPGLDTSPWSRQAPPGEGTASGETHGAARPRRRRRRVVVLCSVAFAVVAVAAATVVPGLVHRGGPGATEAEAVRRLLGSHLAAGDPLAGKLAATCDDVAASVPAFERLVADRRMESAQARALRVDRLPHGAELRQAIGDAYRFSLYSDQAHLKHAKYVTSLGCGPRNAPNSEYLQQATGLDDRAAAAKRRVVELWTPIARKEHLPVYQWNQL